MKSQPTNRFSRTWALAVTLAFAATADAQFIAQTSSNLWAPRHSRQESTTGYGYSDGSTENAFGLTEHGEIVWFQGVDTNDKGLESDEIIEIASANGRSGSTAGAPAGSAGGVYVYDDPGGDDTNPRDLTGADLRGSAAWTTCCPNTDTLEPVAISNAAVSDGFWIAASLPCFSGEFPAPMDESTVPSNGHSWVTGEIIVGWDPQDPTGGLGFSEMASIGFDCHWVMSARGGGATVFYCTAKTGLVCGPPSISATGTAYAGGSTEPYMISASPARGGKSGVVMYSNAGRGATPWQGGYFCLNPFQSDFVRHKYDSWVVSSGGTNGQCDGVFAIDFNAYIASGDGPAYLDVPGETIQFQWWGSDSVATGAFLSDAGETELQ